MEDSLARKFCSCVKQVSKKNKNNNKTRKNRNGSGRRRDEDGRAIAICTKSMLQKKRGVTLRKFTCGEKEVLEIQPFLK